jgi:transcriptional regulator with XRE-family HTH domain
MNVFHQIRNALGLNQQSLANLLGVSLALIKKAETNHRNLPADALSRLVWMLDLVQKLPENKIEWTFSDESVVDLLHKIKKKKSELDDAIEKSNLKNQQMQRRLLLKTALVQQFPADKFHAEASQINALGFEAQSFLQQDNSENELNLLVQQAGLAAMIDFLERHVPKT